MRVSELISDELVTVQPHDPVKTMRERMARFNVHALPVINDEGSAEGIVTSSDFDSDVKQLESTSAADLMSDQVYDIDHEASAREAAQKMCDLGVHHLLVTQGGKAIAMLSSSDLLRAIAREDG